MPDQTEWKMEADYIQGCNCDYGCPCNFQAKPTYGHCEGLNAWRIKKGTFGKTKLDGVKFAVAAWWPKSIPEGGGKGRYYVDAAASPEQRKAIEEITSGRHGGAVFEILPKTWAKHYPLKTTKIDIKLAGPNSSFKVEGVGESASEPIKNPMSGAAYPITMEAPGGIVFTRALVTSIKSWWMKDGDLSAKHADRAGFVTTVKMSNKGHAA